MDGLEKQLRDLIVSQGELIGSVSHDLKGLISGVDGGLYLIDSGLKKDKQERIDQGFEMLKRNLNRMRRQVSNVLYYVKDRELDLQLINIQEVFDSLEKAFSEYANYLGITLKIEKGVGSFSADDLAVYSLFANILEYLLENCRLVAGKVPIIITLSASMENDRVLFDFFVEGFSMEPEAKNYALSSYYSPKGVDRSHLGLFVSHKIAKNHNGTMAITSSLEEGSTRFMIRLPKVNPPGLSS